MPKKSGLQSGKGGKINVTKDGPYIVSGGLPLTIESISVDREGNPEKWVNCKKYPAQENYALCRCGRSQDKPYCDGTHAKVGFNGAETASNKPYLKQAQTYEGPNLTLTDAEDLCAVARFCHKQGGTWNLTEQSADPQARKMAIEEAGNCPSGRLVAC
jgi:CDGSH-type Zn-finger protein